MKKLPTDMPFMVSFSGGRTSALLTRIMLDNVPADQMVICFANTGKEHEGTLDFVHECEVRWGVQIHWIEYDAENRFKIVDYNTASRNGRPYAELIKKRRFVPNVVTRYCTTELKVRPIKRFMQSLGFEEWYNVIGIRYDEPRRYHKLPRGCEKEPYETIAPLYDMRITKADVLAYWKQQSWDLQIPEYLGNCDMCFLKARTKLRRIIQDEPQRAKWWADMERITGATFNKQISYDQMQMLVDTQPELFNSEIEINCLCNVD